MRASGHGNGGLTKEQAAVSHVSDSAAIRVGDRVGYSLQIIRALPLEQRFMELCTAWSQSFANLRNTLYLR
jgi:hypothetical protein